MRPNLLTVPQNESRSFDLRHEFVPYFNNPWHFHPEIELNFVASGSGTRFIGQSVERFTNGEIILLGNNLPHYWKNDNSFYNAPTTNACEAVIVRFAEDFVGKDFFHLPETQAIRQLFEQAINGLKLLEPLRTQVAADLKELLRKEGFEQLIMLFTILQKIAFSDNFEIISPNYVPSPLLIKNSKRLGQIIGHLHGNFTKPVSLAEVAALANMNEAAFCRYFKSQTGQTLTQYIIDLRIGYACHLLTNGEESITQVCFDVGFENVSHFIKTFKKMRNQTPFEFSKGVKLN